MVGAKAWRSNESEISMKSVMAAMAKAIISNGEKRNGVSWHQQRRHRQP
jgi:hypothetical protein